MTMTPAEVLVVDDHPVFRRGLRTLLGTEPWVGTVHEAGTGAEALRIVTEQPIDLVALDLGLPDGSGVDVAGRLRRARPKIHILALTMADDVTLIGQVLRAGASGYLLKEEDPDQILAALHTAAGGGLVLGSRVSAAARRHLETLSASLPPPLDQVTPREAEILGHLAAGRSNAMIARSLGLTEKTVRNQLTKLFAKIGEKDRVGAALAARRAGLEPGKSPRHQ
jgi:DNA-binding NarL/FixJ family response regulator